MTQRKQRKLIAVDVDLTVVNPVPKWLTWYQEQTGHNLFDDIQDKDFNLELLMTKHHEPLLFWKDPNLYNSLEPIEGSVEALGELSKSYDIVFVSHCFPEHHHSKHLFLKRNFKFDFGFIDTGDKGYVRSDVFIDDYHKYLYQVQNMNPDCLCIKIKSDINNKCDNYPYMNWKEITELLSENSIK